MSCRIFFALLYPVLSRLKILPTSILCHLFIKCLHQFLHQIFIFSFSFAFCSVPPPHLSPFVDNDAEGHVPEYAEAIERLKAAERKEVLPLPGMGKEDLDDPQSLLGIIDRAEAIEAAKKKQKVHIMKHYLG